MCVVGVLSPKRLTGQGHRRNAETNALLEAALDQYDQKLARQEALLRAFDGSGKSAEEFADMYGMDKRDVNAALARRQRQQSPAAKP